MAHPLELAYQWRPPVFFATVGAVVCLGVVLRGDAPGRVGVALVIVALWGLFVAVVGARTRALVVLDGPRLTVRHLRRTTTLSGPEVVAVRQFLTPHGPSYRLVTVDADGRRRTVVAPVALLRSGHSTLFAWILTHAPQATLDRGSSRTLEQLRVRGLVP